jgi:hypothetical protein
LCRIPAAALGFNIIPILVKLGLAIGLKKGLRFG